MKHLLKDTKLFIGIGVILALVFGYYYFFCCPSAAPNISTNTTSPVSQDLLVTLQNLHTITLDSGVFSDPVFVSLSDFGTTIPPQQTGRTNPFAPVP